MTVCARLAQLAKSLTANQEVPGTTPGTVDLVSRRFLGGLKRTRRAVLDKNRVILVLWTVN